MKQEKVKKAVYEQVITDYTTGEIMQHEVVSRREVEPEFVKLYLDCICTFKGLSKSLNPILLEFLQYMSYANRQDKDGGQIIYTNAALKKDIAKRTGVSLKRIEQALTQLVKSGVFRRIATGTYQVNAQMFGKGEWSDVKNIRALFDFGAGTVDAEIVREEDGRQRGEDG